MLTLDPNGGRNPPTPWRSDILDRKKPGVSATPTDGTFGETQHIPTLRQTTTELSIRVQHDFSGPSQRTIETATADHLLAHVEQLRLQHLPHKGSKLDRVCTWAVYFTGVVQREIFVKTHEDAARLVLGACHTLLELCERQIDLVHTAFALFNDIGRALTLSVGGGGSEWLGGPGEFERQTLASAHTELVRLAVDVALYCERGGGTAGEFDAHFAARADALFARRGAMVDVLWKHCTSRHNKDSGGVFVEMDQIRRFLAPAEGVVKALASRRWRSRSSHDHVEYTCEWFEPLLQDFFAASDDTVYHITGPSGCGKSELAQWIAERMRCCLETDQCEVFAFFVEEDVRTEASGIHIARGLLLQLFESSIGNLELYEELSRLVRHDAVHDVRALEQALWAAIELGLRNRRAVLLVDGLDHLAGEDDGARVLDHLHRVTSKSPAAKAFVLSAPLERHASSRSRLLSIGEEHTRRDLERVFEKAIASAFPVLSAGDHSTVNQRLITLSSGSFTHATLALELAKRENTLGGVMRTLDDATDSMTGIVQKILGRLRHEERNEMRLILAWMLAAERPLSISEVRVLLEVDVGNLKMSMMITDIKNDLYRAIGPLIRTDGEVLRFKHPLIRRILVQLASDTRSGLPFNMQEAHSMLVSRCIASANISLTDRIGLSVEPLSSDIVARLFQRHSLLRYTSKYWAIHFKHSSMYSADGEHSLTAEFRNAFPASTGLAVLEFTRWEGCTLPQDAASFFEIALQIRQSLIPHHGDAAIIQTLLALARVYRRLSWFSSRSSSNLATLAAGYIDSIENMTVREELLHFLVGYHRHTHGPSGAPTIRYTRLMVELLHKHKGHVDRAIEVQEELYHVCVKEYGIQHAETMSIHRDLVALLREEGRTEQLSSHERRRWMTIRDTLAPDDAALIAAVLDMVAHHEERNEFTEAKAVFTYMLESMSREMHGRSTSVILRERKLEITMKYHAFLNRHDRTEEAQNVLIGVWTQYHEALHVTDISETELSIILTVGRTMKKHRSLETAQTIFQSLWSYFKRVDQRSSSLAIETAQSLSITSKEIMEFRTSRTTTVEETPITSTEELEDIFSSLTTTTASSFCSSSSSSTTSTSAHSSIITTADTLSALYEQRSDWTRATTTTVRALEIVWPSILETSTTHSSSNSATLSSTLSSTKDIAVTLSTARRLAHCHFAQRRVTKAETIHVRIFEAAMRLGVRHEHFLAAAEELVAFYETVFRFEDAAQTLEEAYAALKDAFEAGHEVVVKVGYRLARLCHELQMLERARDVFGEIVVALCGGARGEGSVLRWEAVEAAIALCELHGGFRHWDKALQLYERLWRTLVEARGEGHGWTYQMVERLYHGYVGVLETEFKVEHSTLVQVTVEFRRKSVEMFGEMHEVSIDASLKLAEVYERSEEHHELAISMYETVISLCSSSFDESTVTKFRKSRQRLAYLYSKHTATSSQGFSIFEEEVRKTAVRHGYASVQTTEQLRELVAFSSRSEVTEIRTATLQLLEKVVRQIAISEKRKERHIDSAHSIMTMFKELGSLHSIQTLTRSLRQQLITEQCGTTSSASSGQHSFTFIVALEKALLTTSQSSMQVVSFDELEETLRTECRLHQDYTRAANANAFSDTITHGCRLVAFLQHHGRTEESERFEIQLRSHFAGALDSTDSSTVLQDFFDICVREIGTAGTGTDPLGTVIAACVAVIRRHLDDPASRKGFELAGLVHQFLRLIHGGVAANMQTVLQLALWLAGRGGARRHMDKKLSQKMRDLSAELLRDVLSSTDLRAAASHMPLRELNDLVGLLGDLREWKALETVLSTAWSTRTASSPLTIGLRLSQIRFLLHSHHHSSTHHSSPDPALRLAGDIAYNLLQIWGAGDRSTRRAFAVLATLLVAAGERARAADVLAEALEGVLDAVAVGECARAEAGRWVGEVWGNIGGAVGLGRECELGDGRQQQQQRWVGLRGRVEAELGVRLALGLGGGGWESGKAVGDEPVCGFASADGMKAREEEEERHASAWGSRARGREEAWMPESWEFLEKGEEAVHRNNLRKTSGLDGRVRTPFVIHADKARVPSLSVGSESATTDDEVLGWGDGQVPALREIGQGKGHKVESEEYVMKKLDDGLAGDHFFRMHA